MKIKYDARIQIEYLNSFRPYRLGKYKIICSPLQLETWRREIDEIISSKKRGKILKQKANILIEKDFLLKEPFQIKKIVIKEFIHRNKLQFLISPFRKSKAARTFVVAQHLINHNLDTPVPLAIIEKRRCGFVTECYYVSEAIAAHQKIRKLVRQEEPDQQLLSELAAAVASYCREMHNSGMLHNDLNLANFLYYQNAGNSWITLIDLNRATLKQKQLSFMKRMKDLSRLAWRDHKQEFLENYTQADQAYDDWLWYFYMNRKLRKKRRKIIRKIGK